jgi:hypothetical protein
MKRFLLAALLAAGVAGVIQSNASAGGGGDWPVPWGVGNHCHRVGRIEGYWFQPSRGPLYDYSAYFAAQYPYMPGANEYQWRPNGYGAAPYGPGAYGPAPYGAPAGAGVPAAHVQYGPIQATPGK